MTQFRVPVLAGLLVLTVTAAGSMPASAKISNLDRRNGGSYEVSPAMMHAIDVIVAEKMKMRRHGR